MIKKRRGMLNNKKAEKYLSIWWFFVLAMIAMGIVAGVLIFYGADVNVKGLEAEILSGRWSIPSNSLTGTDLILFLISGLT